MKKFIVPVLAVVLIVGLVVKSRPASEPLPERETPLAQAVRIQSVQKEPLREYIYASGTVRSVQREFLAFEGTGKVVFIAPGSGNEELREGDRVQKGQLLARLDERDQQAALAVAQAGVADARQQLAVAEVSLRQANVRLDFANKRLARERELFDGGASSAENVETSTNEQIDLKLSVEVARAQLQAATSGVAAAEAKATQAGNDLERTRIISPIDGLIAHRNIQVGWLFSPQSVRTDSEQSALRTCPFVVIDPTQYEVTLDIPDYQSGRLERGQEAEVRLASENGLRALGEGQSGSVIAAEVHAVSPGIAPGGRSVRVHLRTDSGASVLADGQYVQCAVLAGEKQQALTIPLFATMREDGEVYTFVVEEGVARRRSVAVGLRNDTLIEVVGGLVEGNQVVTDGAGSLYDGMPVRVLSEADNGE